MTSRFWRLIAALAAANLSPLAGLKAQTDIPALYRDAAAFWNLPDPALLYAIALAESRRRSSDGAIAPWPWTLNINGDGRYYETQDAAWTALDAHIAAGVRNIDIGLMQINYRWNEDVMTDPYLALDPAANLNIGARILADEYRKCGDWGEAVGRYHAPGATREQRARAARYRARVADLLQTLNGESKP